MQVLLFGIFLIKDKLFDKFWCLLEYDTKEI